MMVPGNARWLRARGLLLLAVVTGDLVCRAGMAHAAPSTNEILDLLSWVLILPLGVAQMVAGVWVRKHVGKSVFGWTSLATVVSLAAGIAVAVSLEDRNLVRPVTLALYFCPGIPTFIALARRKLWGPAFLLFSLLPGLLAPLPR